MAVEDVSRFDFEFAQVQNCSVACGGNAAAGQRTFVGKGMHEAEEVVVAFGRNVGDAKAALRVGGGVEVHCENAGASVSVADTHLYIRDGGAVFRNDAD